MIKLLSMNEAEELMSHDSKRNDQYIAIALVDSLSQLDRKSLEEIEKDNTELKTYVLPISIYEQTSKLWGDWGVPTLLIIRNHQLVDSIFGTFNSLHVQKLMLTLDT